jgi:hypothetical protein
LVSYGGGHALIVKTVAEELQRRGQSFDLLGLTTAEMAFRRAGLNPFPISELVDPAADGSLRGAQLAPTPDHPDITVEQTKAYFAVGFADLVERFGREEAEARVAREGRKAFEPVTAFVRLIERLKPTVVVTTTSPRFELAALKAARRCGVPSIAIGDMYLVAEQEWILAGEYADHLTVISADVADMLAATGKLTSRVYVLGNPAFDALGDTVSDREERERERDRLKLGDRTCILWPLGGAAVPVAGRSLLEPQAVADFLESVCDRDPSFTYILRPHPNWPVQNLALRHGCVDDVASLEQALLAADVVCVEASTVGLQAVLKGVPTICFNFADYVLYPDYGWAAKADILPELARLLISRSYFAPPGRLRDNVGGATARVCDLIEQVIGRGVAS